MDHGSLHTPAEIYNGLHGVELANQCLRAMDHQGILMDLGAMILDYNVEDAIGVRLLHNHNTVSHGETMLEKEELDGEGQYCLSTMATENFQLPPEYAATSWKLHHDRFVSLEYSTDPCVIAHAEPGRRMPELFAGLAELLRRNGVMDLLGPCIAPRAFYTQRRPNHAAILVETTDQERRANQLRFTPPRQHAPDRLIETSWVFKKPMKADKYCSVVCEVTCQTSCATGSSGSHSSSHSKGHHKLNIHA